MTSSTSNDHVARTVGTYLLIFSLVFGMSATVNKNSLKKQIVNKIAWLTGIFIQFVVLPFLGFAIIKALDLESPSGITLLVLLSSPGGAYSNWCCSIFNADLALSVSMTLISNFLSIVMMPCNLILYSTHIYGEDIVESIDWLNLFIGLLVVFMATAFGSFCSASINTNSFHLFANRMGNISGLSLTLFTFLVIQFAADVKINLFSQPWEFYLGIATPCVFALALATFFTTYFKLPKPERLAVAIESSFQNGGIATSFALAMYHPAFLPDVLAIPLYYTLVQSIISVLYCTFAWKIGWTKAPINDSVCLVIGKPYEISDNMGEGNNLEENDVNAQTTVDNVLEQSIDDGIVSVHLQTMQVENPYLKKESTHNINTNSPETYVDDRSLSHSKTFLFRKKSKVMDSEIPTLSPTSTLSPEAFEHTTKNGKSFRSRGRKKSGRSSIAVQKTLVLDDTIKEDSIGEDPDISIAGESDLDLESGLSLSRHNADDASLSGFYSAQKITENPAIPETSTSNATNDPSTSDVNPSSSGRPPLDKRSTPPRSNTSQSVAAEPPSSPSISRNSENTKNSSLTKGETNFSTRRDLADPSTEDDTISNLPATEATSDLPLVDIKKVNRDCTEASNDAITTNGTTETIETPETSVNYDTAAKGSHLDDSEKLSLNKNIHDVAPDGYIDQGVSTAATKEDLESNTATTGKIIRQADDFSIGSRSKYSI
mmetsp:Transcript_2297/g.3266  ORF Transcript_2297/g.3266 Transcript_2297/m.3266 type:complete len:714 (-) Transcript_2297:102-2243(-)